MKSNLETLVNQDYGKITTRIESFISSYVLKSSAKGLVIGLSGGLDSSVVLKLAVDTLGASKVMGIMMPSDITPKDDVDHAIELAESLGIKYLVIDINPLLTKYIELLPDDKRQVRALAKFLGIPASIVEKKSSPRLWESHLAEEEIGMDYETLDPTLHLLVDRKLKPKEVAKKLGIPTDQIDKVRDMIEASKHKRSPAATP